jgi:DNA-binding IclR family transcriptional regulator
MMCDDVGVNRRSSPAAPSLKIEESTVATAPSTQPTYHVQVLDRAFDVLDVLAENGGELGATEVASTLGLHKSTVHRLLMILQNRHFVARNPSSGKYHLGWRLFELGSLAVSRLDIYEIARPHLEQLVKVSGETAHLGVLRGAEIISLLNVETTRSVRTPASVGRRTPLYCTSLGKALLAHVPGSVATEVINQMDFQPFTSNTLTRGAFEAELTKVREQGYALDNEEFEEGLRCVGVPVRNHAGDVVAAISIAGPAFRVGGVHLPGLIRSVILAAQQLSAALGYCAA